MGSRSVFKLLPIFALFLSTTRAQSPVQVAPPSSSPSSDIPLVASNFYGVSFELSFINDYFGNSTTSIPQTVLNYLNALHNRTAGSPLKLRLGGNSMDSSTYNASLQQIIQFTDPTANVNDQPVDFGGQLFPIMKTASDSIGGIQWLIGAQYLSCTTIVD